MTNWQEVKLDDICNINTETYSLDENLKYVNYLDTGNITSNRIENIQHIDLYVDKLPSRARRKVKNGNIIYSTVRPNQLHYGLIKEQPDNFLVSTGFAVLDIDTTKAIPEYVYYSLTQTIHTEALQAIAEQSTSAYPSIKSSDIGNRIIPLPPLDVQKKIAGVLGALDDKIELNNKINNNLEQQAQALFKQYFPDIKLGNKNIGEYLSPKRGKNLLSKDAVNGIVPVVAGGLSPAAYHNQANTIAPVITISASGANAGYVNLWHIPVWSSDSSFIDATITPYVYFWYVTLKMRQQEIFESQTGSAQPHIYPQHIENMPIKEINLGLVKKYNEDATPLYMLIGHNQQENTRLSALRDTLLPKLMSGKIDVSKVDINKLNAADMLL